MIEPMTGGKIWTFSNGMRVVYKNSGKEGLCHYEMLVKTGFSQAMNLENAEKPYLSALLGESKIAGMPGREFRRMLNANGIHMATQVSVSDINIKGTAPDTELPLLLKSLLAIAYDRTPDHDAWEYYNACSNLNLDYFRNSKVCRRAVLDSMICPSLSHSAFRRPLEMKPDFMERGNRFFDTAFSRASDGILILVGKFDEDDLKKILTRHIGGFKSEEALVSRSRKQDDCITGKSVLIQEGTYPSLDLMFATPINYTAENFMNIKVASMAMGNAISKVAASMGWSVSFSGKFIMFPEEKFNLTVQMEPSVAEGLPASMVQEQDVEKLLQAVDVVIEELGQKGLEPSLFAAYKALLGNMLDEDMADPAKIQDFLIMRYSYGKDLMTKYKDKLNALNVGKVNSFLTDMAHGALAEYGVKSKAWTTVNEVLLPPIVLPKSAPVRPASDTLGINKVYRSLFTK